MLSFWTTLRHVKSTLQVNLARMRSVDLTWRVNRLVISLVNAFNNILSPVQLLLNIDETTSRNGSSPVPPSFRSPPVPVEKLQLLYALSGFEPLTVPLYQGWSLDYLDSIHGQHAQRCVISFESRGPLIPLEKRRLVRNFRPFRALPCP